MLELNKAMSQTVNFVNSVKAFCAWAESEPLVVESEVREAIHMLVRIYSTVLPLAVGDPNFDIDAKRITDEKWKTVFKRFGSLPFNYYNLVFDPTKVEPEAPVVGDIADDFADIYRDLNAGLSLYEGGHEAEAIWEWKQSFNSHWGRHVTSALYALHTYAVAHDIEL